MSHQLFSLQDIRQLLKRVFDDSDLDAFCQDYFLAVYDNFSRGMRKDEKITLLLDHCRRTTDGIEKLLDILEKRFRNDQTLQRELIQLRQVDWQDIRQIDDQGNQTSSNMSQDSSPTAQGIKNVVISDTAVKSFFGGITVTVADKIELIPGWLQFVITIILIGILFLIGSHAVDLYGASLPKRMTGDFNIAVAQFQVKGQGNGFEEAQQLAQNFANAIEREISELSRTIEQNIEIRSPNETGVIQGGTEKERAEEAYALAEMINADVVIYGIIEVDNLTAKVKPEFYVSSTEFAAAAEVTGQYRMGSAVPVDKIDNLREKQDASETLAKRFRALTFIVYGLADHVIGHYALAETNFNQALAIEAWDNPDVIYVMLGNAALKQKNLANAESYYIKALDNNPDYARAFAGLGSVYYAQALGNTQSDTFETTDIRLLNQSIETYQKALNPILDQPPLADVPTKAVFGLSQAYLLKAITEADLEKRGAVLQDFGAAIQALQTVIEDFGQGKNPRVQELAAHAHARLGLIYRQTGQAEAAIPEYERAVNLLPGLERTREYRANYEAALGDIYSKLGDSSQAIEWYERAVADIPPGSSWASYYQKRLEELR